MKEEEIKGMKAYRDRCVKLMAYIMKHYESDAFLTKPSFEKLIEKVAKEIVIK